MARPRILNLKSGMTVMPEDVEQFFRKEDAMPIELSGIDRSTPRRIAQRRFELPMGQPRMAHRLRPMGAAMASSHAFPVPGSLAHAPFC